MHVPTKKRAIAKSSPRSPGACRMLRCCTGLRATLPVHSWKAGSGEPDAVYVRGPPELVDAGREVYPAAESESFVPPTFDLTGETSGGHVTFTDSAVEIVDDGRPLLNQAEDAGLNPESGCRMGICF